MNRHALKILCVLVAMLIWMQVASSRQMERDVTLPLVLEALPAGATLAGNTWPEKVKVRARGTKLQFFRQRYLGRAPGEVRVSLKDVAVGGLWQRDLTSNDVRSSLEEVTVLEPQRLLLFIDHLDSLRVPVSPVTTGDVPSGKILLGRVEAVPDSVLLIGPHRLMPAPDSLRTEPLDLRRARRGQPVERRVIPPGKNLSVAPEFVTLNANVVEAESRTLEHVPVVPLVDADQPAAEVFPPVVSVTLVGPRGGVDSLTLADVSVTVALTGLGPGSHTLAPAVLLPEDCRLQSVAPEQVLVVLGAAGDSRADERSPLNPRANVRSR